MHYENKLQDMGVEGETNHSKNSDLPKICRSILFSVILRIIESSNWNDREEIYKEVVLVGIREISHGRAPPTKHR